MLKSIAKGSTDQDVACLNIIKLFCVFLQVAHFPRQGTSLPHKEYDYDYAIHKTKIEFQSRKTRVKYGPVVCLPLEVRGRLSVCV